MKKFLLALTVLIILLLVSAYIEDTYCHYWTTTEPIGSSSDYIKNNTFCKINSSPAIIGILILIPVKDVIDWVQ